jgi:hypothetical protein
MTDDDIKALREAIAAGPTDGPWITAGPSFGDPLPRFTNGIIRDTDDGDCEEVCRFDVRTTHCNETEINAAYIAAASPDRIARLLAEVERLRALQADQHAELDELREACAGYRSELRSINDAMDGAAADGKMTLPERVRILRRSLRECLRALDKAPNADLARRIATAVLQTRGAA